MKKERMENELLHLPIYDHCSVFVLSTLSNFLEEKVINLGVPVHQRHQLL